MLISSKKCLKCGRSPSTHPGTKLFHYPKPGTRNYLRCEIWAKYCFPGDESSSQEFQEKLYKQGVLCDKHFKTTSFFDHPNGTTKLSADAVPVSDDEVLQSLVEPPESNTKNLFLDEKDLDPYQVTIKQEKAETDFDPHLVTIKKEPDDSENSNYVNDENDIKPENIKCEIKEEAFAGSSLNELPQETSLDTGIKEEYEQENMLQQHRCGEEIASRLSSDAEDDKLVTGIVLSQNLTSSAKRSLQAHPSVHLGDKPFSCDICERKFSRRDILQVHLRTHTGEKPFSCNLCDRKFSHRWTLQLHLRTHTGEKPYSCDHCERKFSQSSALLFHLRTHTGEKPYSCDICERKFSQSSALQLHLRTHSGEKPYTCDICERNFSLRNCLQVHLRTHTGEKPFSCDICERKFAQRDALQVHLRTHRGKKLFSCDICELKFSMKSKLQLHLRTTHTAEKPFLETPQIFRKKRP